MDESDWIQLWLLNELILGRSPLSRLIAPRLEHQPRGYWAFPARAALRAPAEARVDALYECLKQGWIEVYLRSCLKDTRFASLRPCVAGECSFRDARFLETAETLLTFQGHKKWEDTFQPDWARFWNGREESHDASTGGMTLSIVYSSDSFFQELLRYLPAYWGLDSQVGLTELECHTMFQHQATCWKVLPCVKVIMWKGQSHLVELNKLLRESSPAGVISPKLKHYMQVRDAASDDARRALSRLSKKWE